MKKEKQTDLYAAFGLLTAFSLWTAILCFADVQPVGPHDTSVGLAAMNLFFHNLTGVHMSLYTITDFLGLVPLGFIMGFALLGLRQWVKRKYIREVDYSILVLGGFYLVVVAIYVLFEIFAVNYRPVLINGYPEVSYPSSTTMLVLCVMQTALMQLNARISNIMLKRCVAAGIRFFIIFMVIGRLISGVHWLSDIIGGILLSTGLTRMYRAVIRGNIR